MPECLRNRTIIKKWKRWVNRNRREKNKVNRFWRWKSNFISIQTQITVQRLMIFYLFFTSSSWGVFVCPKRILRAREEKKIIKNKINQEGKKVVKNNKNFALKNIKIKFITFWDDFRHFDHDRHLFIAFGYSF